MQLPARRTCEWASSAPWPWPPLHKPPRRPPQAARNSAPSSSPSPIWHFAVSRSAYSMLQNKRRPVTYGPPWALFRATTDQELKQRRRLPRPALPFLLGNFFHVVHVRACLRQHVVQIISHADERKSLVQE